MKSLSKRLQVIADFVDNGAKVADIGTDHAYLPIYLIKAGKCLYVTAADINEKPLMNAKANIEKSGVTGIDLVLSNGLENIERSKIDTVIIAGMGGEVIRGILENCIWAKDENITYILQPMSSAEELREFIAFSGFSVLKETAVTDANKVYSVMKVKYTAVKTDFPPSFLYIGILGYTTPDNRKYINKQYMRVCDTINGFKSAKKDFSNYLEIKKEIETVMEKR